MAYVRDIMKQKSIVAKTNDNIQRISKELTEKKVSNMPVVNAKGELVGVVSEQDIIRAMQSESFMKMSAKDIMTTNVLSVKENDCLEYVSKIFMEQPYRQLPVTRNKKVIGVITREDIINSFLSHYY
ncbi:MAG: CBS domain-containing protein [Candidatus Omnitrophica bacterium]|nr:CBS domain-containing protein [Candidatus Omnitrophota bacterium]